MERLISQTAAAASSTSIPNIIIFTYTHTRMDYNFSIIEEKDEEKAIQFSFSPKNRIRIFRHEKKGELREFN